MLSASATPEGSSAHMLVTSSSADGTTTHVRNLVRFYAKPTTIPRRTPERHRDFSARRSSEREAGVYGVGHERLAEPRAHRVLGSPAGAVRGHEHARCQIGQVVEDLGDERLERRPTEVESA